VRRRRLGALVVLGGGAFALVLQVLAPVGVPLYDGVQVVEPYRFLHPGSGQAGDPTSFTATLEVTEGVSPTVAARTGEQPPQAQMIGQQGAFELTPGATAVVASITAVEPPAQPASGPILGNAYRFSVTDQSGDALAIKACSGCVSLVLRAPDGTVGGTLAHFEGGSWVPVETRHAGTVGLYQANPTVTGIYAIVSTGQSAGGGPDVVLLLAIAGVALIFVAFVTLLYLRARPQRLPVAEFRRGEAPRPPARTPSKKKRSRRPPRGRSGS
jgi:hypothetical protein